MRVYSLSLLAILLLGTSGCAAVRSIEQWKSEPDNRLHLEHMLRGLHTLKGGARLSGLTKLGDSTHQYESFLIDAQTADAKTDSEFFAELHDRYDELASLLTLIRRALAGDSAAPPTLPKADILTPKETSRAAPRVKQPAKAADVPAEKPAKSPEPGAPKEATNVRSLKPLAASSEPKAAAPAKLERPDQRTAQEMVRVGSGLLETLVNLAGESSIIRARVEQGLSDFTLSLDEVVIASSVAGPGWSTLPMVVFSKVRLGVSPDINALATIMVAVVAVGVVVAGVLMSRQQKIRDRDAQMALAANQQMIESLKKG